MQHQLEITFSRPACRVILRQFFGELTGILTKLQKQNKARDWPLAWSVGVDLEAWIQTQQLLGIKLQSMRPSTKNIQNP